MLNILYGKHPALSLNHILFFLQFAELQQSALTFAGSNVVHVQLVALLGALQGALGGEEVA